ncbi:hypothetical protein WA026_018292, partial [Henosepilachna vigintioctopunctata]
MGLLSFPSKIMNSTSVDVISAFLLNHHVKLQEQHEFVKGRTSSTNLLNSMNYRILDSDKKLQQTYLVFAKSFDTIPTGRLKLKYYETC